MGVAGQQMESSEQCVARGGSHLGRGEWGRGGEEVDGGRMSPQVNTGNAFLLEAKL